LEQVIAAADDATAALLVLRNKVRLFHVNGVDWIEEAMRLVVRLDQSLAPDALTTIRREVSERPKEA
jgi:hypothetical protein